jgi:hypothetical protein
MYRVSPKTFTWVQARVVAERSDILLDCQILEALEAHSSRYLTSLHWYGRFQLHHTVMRYNVHVSLGVKYRIGNLTEILIVRVYPRYGIVDLGIGVQETIEVCRW